MLTKPDAKQLAALARISRSSDGEVLMQLLETELQSITTSLLDTSDTNTPRVQGMGKECKSILDLIRESPKLADKTR